jgi:hypothetical protein
MFLKIILNHVYETIIDVSSMDIVTLALELKWNFFFE